MKLSELTHILRTAGIENARGEAIMLFEHFGGLKRERLLFEDSELSTPELLSAAERRKKREPLQYILGFADFYNERYIVSPDCLIPRQDTEILVEIAARLIPMGERFIDLCTGSGCIAISTLRATVGTSAIAVDISPGALEIARRNAERLDVSKRIHLVEADALAYEPEAEPYAVLSNPPYVTEDAYSRLEPELYHEPRLALVGTGEDGCGFYKRIISVYSKRIKKEGFIALEIGYDQAEVIRLLAAEVDMSCEVVKDYSGNDRVCVLRHRQ